MKQLLKKGISLADQVHGTFDAGGWGGGVLKINLLAPLIVHMRFDPKIFLHTNLLHYFGHAPLE